MEKARTQGFGAIPLKDSFHARSRILIGVKLLIKQEIDYALTLAGWNIKVNGVIQGGIAPDINAIKTSQEKVPLFVFMLFRRCVIVFA